MLAAGCNDGQTILIDVAKRQQIASLKDQTKPGMTTQVTWMPDSKTLVCACGGVQLWDVPSRILLTTLPHPFSQVVAVSENGQTMCSSGFDKKIKFWDRRTFALLGTLENPQPVLALAYDPTGKYVAAGGQAGGVTLHPLGRVGGGLNLAGHKRSVQTMAFSPNGKLLASGGDDGLVCLWDVGSRQLLATEREPAGVGVIRSVAFGNQGKVLVTACIDGHVRCYDVSKLAP
jgi:WD40 repeat protein